MEVFAEVVVETMATAIEQQLHLSMLVAHAVYIGVDGTSSPLGTGPYTAH